MNRIHSRIWVGNHQCMTETYAPSTSDGEYVQNVIYMIILIAIQILGCSHIVVANGSPDTHLEVGRIFRFGRQISGKFLWGTICQSIKTNITARSMARTWWIFLISLQVCRGFYLASRSSDIWRLVCLRTWGVTVLPISLKKKVQNNDWRAFFLKRPRYLILNL